MSISRQGTAKSTVGQRSERTLLVRKGIQLQGGYQLASEATKVDEGRLRQLQRGCFIPQRVVHPLGGRVIKNPEQELAPRFHKSTQPLSVTGIQHQEKAKLTVPYDLESSLELSVKARYNAIQLSSR